MSPSKEVCCNFHRGHCQYGDRCRFLHANQQQEKPNPFGFGTQNTTQFPRADTQPQKPNPFGFGVQNNAQKANQFKPGENKWSRFSPAGGGGSSAPQKQNNQSSAPNHVRGLSESEINFLKEDKSLQDKILRSGSTTESTLAMDKIKRPLYEKHPMAKFSWTVTEETDMIEWYNSCLNALNNVEKLSQEKDVAHIIQSKVIQLLHGKDEDLKLQWEKDLKSGDLSGVHAECLTDTWIGKDRWAFIDLSAGPFSWGPAVGGEGVRTELSLPNVEKTIGAVADFRKFGRRG